MIYAQTRQIYLCPLFLKAMKKLSLFLTCVSLLIGLTAFQRDGGYIGISPDRNPQGDGLVILQVHPNTPGEKAGLQAGDVIKTVDGKAFNETNDLTDYIQKKKPGDTVKLLVERNGKELEKAITLGKRPANAPANLRIKDRVEEGEKVFEERMKNADATERNQVEKVLKDGGAATVRVLVGAGGGSGVLIENGKYMITAGHVVVKSPTASFILPDGRAFKAKVLKSAQSPVDLAICEVINPKGERLPSVSLGVNSKNGDEIVILGYPGMLGRESKNGEVKVVGGIGRAGAGGKGMPPLVFLAKVTGKVSKKNAMFSLVTLTKVPPLPGNSGGPAFNLSREVIGIVIKSDLNKGGFATPVSWVRKWLEDIQAGSNKNGFKESGQNLWGYSYRLRKAA